MNNFWDSLIFYRKENKSVCFNVNTTIHVHPTVTCASIRDTYLQLFYLTDNSNVLVPYQHRHLPKMPRFQLSFCPGKVKVCDNMKVKVYENAKVKVCDKVGKTLIRRDNFEKKLSLNKFVDITRNLGSVQPCFNHCT